MSKYNLFFPLEPTENHTPVHSNSISKYHSTKDFSAKLIQTKSMSYTLDKFFRLKTLQNYLCVPMCYIYTSNLILGTYLVWPYRIHNTHISLYIYDWS